MNKARMFLIMIVLAVAGTPGYTFVSVVKSTATVFVSFSIAPPHITHKQVLQVSALSDVVMAGIVTSSAPLRAVTVTYFTDSLSAPATASSSPGGASPYTFSISMTPDLSAATSFYYVLQASDSVRNSTRLPATGYYCAAVAHAAKENIGSDGGTMTLSGGNQFGGHASITIPPGALSSSQTITAAEVNPEDVGITPPSGKFTLGVDVPVIMYQFKPSGLTFDRPATITLLYPDADNDNIVDGTTIAANNLTVLWWNENYRRWDYVGGTVDTIHKMVTCIITHFSVYGVGYQGPRTDNDYRPKEKIITPATADGYNDFANFGGIGLDDTITIYDITGRTIRQLRQGTSRWDGRDQNDRIVESGIYVYQIKLHDKNKPISGTIVVAK